MGDGDKKSKKKCIDMHIANFGPLGLGAVFGKIISKMRPDQTESGKEPYVKRNSSPVYRGDDDAKHEKSANDPRYIIHFNYRMIWRRGCFSHLLKNAHMEFTF